MIHTDHTYGKTVQLVLPGLTTSQTLFLQRLTFFVKAAV